MTAKTPGPPVDDPAIAIAIAAAHAFTDCARPFLLKAADESVGIGQPELSAAATNLALALELYLKALWMLEGNTPPKTKEGHDLARLYEGLSPDLRRELGARFDAVLKADVEVKRRVLRVGVIPPGQTRSAPPSELWIVTLPLVLDRARDAFVTWRYLHEHSQSDEVKTWDFEYRALGTARDLLATVAVERLAVMLGEPGATAS